MNNQAHLKNRKNLKPTIRLEVFRHDEKDTSEHDHTAQLTDKGKLGALKAGRKKSPHMNEGYVLASPRERALHSAILQFFGPQIQDIALHDGSLQEALKKLKNHKIKNKSGKTTHAAERISIDERLNFHVESHAEFNKRFYDEYAKKDQNRTLDFQLKDSDQLILDLAKRVRSPSDQKALGVIKIKGFKRMVGDLAEVLLEYFQKYPQWQKAYEKSPQDYDSPEMQIFVGTHSQNVECFLMKVIEIKEGPIALEDFLQSLDQRKSFIDYSEGFTMEIIATKTGQLTGTLQYKKRVYQISAKELKAMVQERDDFNHEVQKKIEEDPDA